jgi:hypothetical protein
MVGNGHATSGPGISYFQDSGRTLEDIRRIGGSVAIHRSTAGPKLREPLMACPSPAGGGGFSPA